MSCLCNLKKVSSERMTNYSRDYQETSSQKQSAEKSIQEFLQNYQLSQNGQINLIDSIDVDMRNHNDAESKLQKATMKLKDFLENNPDIE